MLRPDDTFLLCNISQHGTPLEFLAPPPFCG